MGFLSGIGNFVGNTVSSVANPVIGGLTGGMGTLGDVLTGGAISNAKAVQDTNQTEIMLSNTQYQRAVKDLEAAGLNPMLAYSNGGASVPNLTPPRPGDAGAGLADTAMKVFGAGGISSAASQRDLQSAQADSAKTQADLNAASTENTDNDTQVKKTQRDLNKQKLQTEKFNTKSAEAQAKQDAMDADVRKSGVDVEKSHAKARQWMKTIGEATGVISDAVSAGTALSGEGMALGAAKRAAEAHSLKMSRGVRVGGYGK